MSVGRRQNKPVLPSRTEPCGVKEVGHGGSVFEGTNLSQETSMGTCPAGPDPLRAREHTEPREEAKAHVGLFCFVFFSWYVPTDMN